MTTDKKGPGSTRGAPAPEPVLIVEVEPGSPAAEAGVEPGDEIISLNGRVLRDILEYQLVCEEDELCFRLLRAGEIKEISLRKSVSRPLGLVLEKSIFDQRKSCRNHCVFCFVDQLPKECRPSLRFKDDDYRLSFLYGNFITLTNLDSMDIQRIIDDRLSPLYVSIHAADVGIRRRLMNPPADEAVEKHLQTLLKADIKIHAQIVACPGVNDGEVLVDTLRTFLDDYEGIISVGVVPVGLTAHRAGLSFLSPFDSNNSARLLTIVQAAQGLALRKKGYRWVYAADEFYLAAGWDLPAAADYDDFPQLENGIGLTRLFLDETAEWAAENKTPNNFNGEAVVLTAPLAAEIVAGVLPRISRATGVELSLITAVPAWLGGRVSVAGLLAGKDIAAAIKSAGVAGPVLIPDVCLNPDGFFLDDMTTADAAAVAGVEIIVVPSSGREFMSALAYGCVVDKSNNRCSRKGLKGAAGV